MDQAEAPVNSRPSPSAITTKNGEVDAEDDVSTPIAAAGQISECLRRIDTAETALCETRALLRNFLKFIPPDVQQSSAAMPDQHVVVRPVAINASAGGLPFSPSGLRSVDGVPVSPSYRKVHGSMYDPALDREEELENDRLWLEKHLLPTVPKRVEASSSAASLLTSQPLRQTASTVDTLALGEQRVPEDDPEPPPEPHPVPPPPQEPPLLSEDALAGNQKAAVEVSNCALSLSRISDELLVCQNEADHAICVKNAIRVLEAAVKWAQDVGVEEQGPDASRGLIDQVVIASLHISTSKGSKEKSSSLQGFTKGFTKKSSDESLLGMRSKSRVLNEPPEEAWAEDNDTEPDLGMSEEDQMIATGVVWVPTCRIISRHIYMPIMHPMSKRRLSWLCTCFACTVYEAFAIPIIIFFGEDPRGFFFVASTFVSLFFIMDIVLSFLTGYMDSDQCLVVRPRRICMRYLRTWFLPDLVASVPLEWMLGDQVSGSKLLFVRFLRFLRLFRLMRMAKLHSLVANLETRLEGTHAFGFATGLLKLLGLLLLACHWAACLWYAVGNTKNGWVEGYAEEHPRVDQRYVQSLYFTLTTMTTVGYGDISPKSDAEVKFALCLLPFASVLFATLMGSLTDLISNLNQKSGLRAKRRMMLNHYLRWRSVPQRLRMRIRTYMLYMWDIHEDYHAYEEEVKKQLPSVLREELSLHFYGRMLNSLPFLDFMHGYSICLRQLASLIYSTHIDKEDNLFAVGSLNETIYVVVHGSMYLSVNQYCPLEVTEQKEEQKKRNIKRSFTGSALAQPRNDCAHWAEIHESVKNMKTIAGKVGSMAGLASPSGKKKNKKARGNIGAYDIFDGNVFNEASECLKVRDLRLTSIVRRMQRRWRAKQALRRHETLVTQAAPRRERIQGGSDMRSHTVAAPAYFGESFLWARIRVEDWAPENAPKHVYNASCKDRGELVCIPRSAIQTVILRYSPWLPDRFGHFRSAVLKSVDRMFPTERHSLFGMGDEEVPRSSSGLFSKIGVSDALKLATTFSVLEAAVKTEGDSAGSQNTLNTVSKPPGSICDQRDR